MLFTKLLFSCRFKWRCRQRFAPTCYLLQWWERWLTLRIMPPLLLLISEHCYFLHSKQYYQRLQTVIKPCMFMMTAGLTHNAPVEHTTSLSIFIETVFSRAPHLSWSLFVLIQNLQTEECVGSRTIRWQRSLCLFFAFVLCCENCVGLAYKRPSDNIMAQFVTCYGTHVVFIS